MLQTLNVHLVGHAAELREPWLVGQNRQPGRPVGFPAARAWVDFDAATDSSGAGEVSRPDAPATPGPRLSCEPYLQEET
jgi:hypothetical protein